MKTKDVKKSQIGKRSNHKQVSVESIDDATIFEKSTNEPGKAKKYKSSPGAAFFIIAVICSVLIIPSCNSPAEKVKMANENVTQANKELVEAQEEYAVDIENYRIEARNRIETNNKRIREYKARIENEKKEARDYYKKRIADLEQKNTDMEKRMDDYKADTKEGWEIFKSQFKKDIDELEMALKNFFTK
jgi:hypothetical protein